MRELYVYYRVRPEHASLARGVALKMQATLRARHAGLQARLLHRPHAADAVQTWMETYACTPGGVDDTLQRHIATAAEVLAPWIDGTRHVEVFIACAS